MIHPEQVEGGRGPVKDDRKGSRWRGLSRVVRSVVCIVAAFTLGACADTVTTVPAAPFGQNGRIQIEVRSPLGDRGQMHEILIWLSSGPWALTERVTYEGNGGAETVTSSRLNPGDLAQEYASLIQQLNDAQGLRLFVSSVPQSLDPACLMEADLENLSRTDDELPDTRVVVSIFDDSLGESAHWTRCAEGVLLGSSNVIGPASAAPSGTGAERVITAAQLTRFFTVGDGIFPTYQGTIPFAALMQGADSPARPLVSQAFASSNGSAPASFIAFWELHAGAGTGLPPVDWDEEVVILAAVGEREEAGEEIRVQRVEPLGPDTGTRVRLIERVPGDFCSPVARDGYPYQIVVVPRARLHFPIQFTEVAIERVTCGA